MKPIDRAILALGALCGLLGVSGSAAAAHSGAGESLRIASHFLLFHAPLVVGLIALAATSATHAATTRLAAGTVLLGLILFSGDLALRALADASLFPLAAQSGGLVLMAGWVLVLVAALWRRGEAIR